MIQRQEGTAHVWRTVLRLGGGSGGSGTLPALGIGRYRLRIANLGRRARMLAQQEVRVAAFGTVSFSTLFGRSTRAYTTALGTFPYVFQYYNGEVDYTAFTVAANTCQSVHLEFIPGLLDESQEIPEQHGTATIVQESADPVGMTISEGSKGVVDARVIPGQSWAVNVAQIERRNNDRLFAWYINGSASCDSTSLISG